MASAWFDSVTGSNDYERQSYRDSYNGGKAAGDWTGNVNKQLDAERNAFQGATVSGSSTQPSAIQTAQAYASAPAPASVPAQGSWVSTGMRGQKVWVPAAVTAGPGSPGAVKSATPRVADKPVTVGPGNAGWSPAPSAAGTGPASVVVQSPLAPLEAKLTPNNTIVMINGQPFRPNPGTSDVSELENMMGEGESPLDVAWWKKQEMAWSHVAYNLNLGMPKLDLSGIIGKPSPAPQAITHSEFQEMMRLTR